MTYRYFSNDLGINKSYIKQQLQIQSSEDFYKLTQSDFEAIEGAADILKQTKEDSYERALCKLFPELIIWKFPFTKNVSFWQKVQNQRLYLYWCIRYYHIPLNDIKKWDALTNEQIIQLGGSTFLELHNNQLWRAYFACFPELQTELIEHWKNEHYKDPDRVRYIVALVKGKYKVRAPIDWLKIPFVKLREELGYLLAAHGGLIGLLSMCDPETDYSWLAKLVGRYEQQRKEDIMKQNYRDAKHEESLHNIVKIRNFIDKVRTKFSIVDEMGWKRLSAKHVESVENGKEMLETHGSISGILQLAYPNIWEENVKTARKEIWKSPFTYRLIFRQLCERYKLSLPSLKSAKASWIVRGHPFGHYILLKGDKQLLPVAFPEESWPPHFKTSIPILGKKWKEKYAKTIFGTYKAKGIALPRFKSWKPSIDPKGSWLLSIPFGNHYLWNGSSLQVSQTGRTVEVPKSIAQQLPKDVWLHVIVYQKGSMCTQREGEVNEDCKILVLDILSSFKVFERRQKQLENLLKHSQLVPPKFVQCEDMVHFQRYMKETEFDGDGCKQKGVLIVPPRSRCHLKDSNCYVARHITIESARLKEINVYDKQIYASQGGEAISVNYYNEHVPTLSANAQVDREFFFVKENSKRTFLYTLSDV